jgi:hypothetical protein
LLVTDVGSKLLASRGAVRPSNCPGTVSTLRSPLALNLMPSLPLARGEEVKAIILLPSDSSEAAAGRSPSGSNPSCLALRRYSVVMFS